jgi:putative sugar O-methyltransferase
MHVTVIMAVRNGAATVQAAVQSLLSQTYRDWDLLIIDDGSTDQTASILESLAQRDPRVRFISSPTCQGRAAARNRGWRLSQSELIAILDADDFCLPERLHCQVEFFQIQPETDVLGTAVELLDTEGRGLGFFCPPTSHEALVSQMYRHNPFVHSSVMMRRRFLEQVNGYDERLRRAEDIDLWLRGYRRFRYRNLERVLVRYTVPAKQTLSSCLYSSYVLASSAWRERLLLSHGWYAMRPLARTALTWIGVGNRDSGRVRREQGSKSGPGAIAQTNPDTFPDTLKKDAQESRLSGRSTRPTRSMIWGRLLYLARKVRWSLREGTFLPRAWRFAYHSFRDPMHVGWRYLRLPAADRRLSLEPGFRDHRGAPGHTTPERKHLERIVSAYQLSKEHQVQAPRPFQVRGAWKEWLAVNYGKMESVLQSGDVATLATLLENFSREDFSAGFAEGFNELIHYRTSPIGQFYIKTVWSEYRNHLVAQGSDLSQVRSPFIGNPAGVWLNGDVIKVDTFRHVYHAVEMLSLLQDCARPRVVEIGGGDGTQAYQTLRLAGAKPVQYIVFDIPEVAVVSSYFLLSAFPDKKICLYGDLSPAQLIHSDFDLAVFPHFAITHLPANSVDLFYNSCSFSEMDGHSAEECLRIIEQSCRKHFMHINHDVTFKYRYPDGSTSTNLIGSKLVPDPRRFRLVSKKPRTFNLPEDEGFPSFEYVYERMANGQEQD